MHAFSAQLVAYLTATYQARTIVLYGSFASHSAHADSDIDVVVFADVEQATHDATLLDGHPLDAWIYPLADWQQSERLRHIYPFTVLLDDAGIAAELARRLAELRAQATRVLSAGERQQLVAWVHKMLKRASQTSLEANYRYHWLLHDFPELFANFRGEYYDGPVKTLRRMQTVAPAFYREYESLLTQAKDVARVGELYRQLIADTAAQSNAADMSCAESLQD